jgi:UDP-glucose 4-epimerase
VWASSGGTVYGDPEEIPTPETAANCPISPYGASKLAGEHYARMLGALRGFDAVSLRYANVFGPRQDPKSEAGVVSIFVSRLLDGRPLTVFGDGRQTRDYVFVRDVARANLLASTALLPEATSHEARAFNIATGRETSVLELAEVVARVMGRTAVIEHAAARPGELFRSSLDIRKARALLGWTPQHSFEDGLPQLVDWFRREAA